MIDMKSILKLLPFASAAGMAWYSNKKYGKKVPKHIAYGGGALSGYALGVLAKSVLAPVVQQPAPAPELSQQQQQIQGIGMGDYIDLDFSQPSRGVQPAALLPARKSIPAQGIVDQVPNDNVIIAGDGVFSTPTSYDTSDIDSVMDEEEAGLRRGGGYDN